VAPQKDPDLFLEILALLRAHGEVAATWVGDGTVEGCARMQDADVTVTGWIPLADVAGVVSRHTVYLHTAGWEASVPIAVLDAMSAGVPTVTRRNAAYRGLLPDDWQFDDAATAAAMIGAFADPERRARRVAEQFALMESLRQRGPETVIAGAYRELLGAARRSMPAGTGS
jgi:glycosyltransferase involved in cell wall biosynthesis